MQKFIIRDTAQAEQIMHAYEHCTTCSECLLHTPEGWRCSYMYQQAKRYLQNNK